MAKKTHSLASLTDLTPAACDKRLLLVSLTTTTSSVSARKEQHISISKLCTVC